MKTIVFSSDIKSLKNNILQINDDAFVLLLDARLKAEDIHWNSGACERLQQVGRHSGAALVYADYTQADGQEHPLNDYQVGSLRDDFDFGKAVWINTLAAKQALQEIPDDLRFSAFYALRLALSRQNRLTPLFHLRENLYRLQEPENKADEMDSEAPTSEAPTSEAPAEQQFAYVDPSQRDYQIEMEKVCTQHLQSINAYLPPRTQGIHLSTCSEAFPVETETFPVEASVIIPVRNRARTIAEAAISALTQVCDFPFNVIVVDNHSTDGTTDILQNLSQEYEHLKLLLPQRQDLNIGGCWNAAINSEHCGRFAIQLDSDDLYSGPDTLQKIVDMFHREQVAMVVGSYRICNFQKETLPPGLIAHREWTQENGHNNALRINGLGAPRAFYTPILRSLQLPNTSYGEDYAVALAITREYRIGRIYEELYLCRRWEDNSDAQLSLAKINANNAYKDSLRSIEVMARQAMNRK